MEASVSYHTAFINFWRPDGLNGARRCFPGAEQTMSVPAGIEHQIVEFRKSVYFQAASLEVDLLR